MYVTIYQLWTHIIPPIVMNYICFHHISCYRISFNYADRSLTNKIPLNNFVPHWTTLNYFETNCTILDISEPFCTIFNHSSIFNHFQPLCTVWIKCNHFELISQALEHFELIRVILEHYEQLWAFLNHFQSFEVTLNTFETYWINLNHCEISVSI